MNCNHDHFESEVKVCRINEVANGEIKVFTVDIKVRCIKCKTNLEFKGLPGGLNFQSPTTSADRTELRAPAEITNNQLTVKMN